MRGVALLSIAVVAALAFAGCSGTKTNTSSSVTGSDAASGSGDAATTTATGTESSAATSGTGTATGTAGATTTAGSSANRAPAISTFTVNKTLGAAPLKVQFKLNATDVDKDALTYKLSFGDGSADATGSLPAGNVTHSFAAAGNYTVKFTVSDGKLSINKTLLVKVTAPAVAGPATTTFTASYEVGSAGLCALGLTGGAGGSASVEAGVTYGSIVFSEDYAGKPFTATFTFTLPAAGLIVAFPDSGGSFAGSESDAPTPSSTTISGTVPAGAAGAFVSSCGGAGVDVTLVVG
mgnify:CR=1 FL=1